MRMKVSTRWAGFAGGLPRPKLWVFFAAALAAAGSVGLAAGPDSDSTEAPAELKKLTLEELLQLDVTSVSKEPEPYGSAPSAIQVVTHDDIVRSGASSIPEALRLADNLEVAQKNSHDWAISARGFNTDLGNKLLVLIDGRAVYTPLFSGVFWNAQDYLMEDLDRIEVVSGPGGALWGANAVNGVINIVSKSARDTQGLYVEGGGGGPALRDFGGVRYGGVLGDGVYYRVYGKLFDRGNEVYADGKNASDSWNMGQGGFRVDADASPQTRLTVQGDLYGSDVSIPTGGLGNASGGNLLGRWSHTVSDRSDMALQFYYDRTHLHDPISNQFGPTSSLNDDLDTVDLDFQHRFPLGDSHRVVWGLGYRYTHDVVGESKILAFLPDRLDHRLYSGFVQDEIALAQNLQLTLGTKLEHNDYTGFEVEPGVRLQWNPEAHRTLWAAVSRSVRTPSRVDRDVAEPDFPPVFLVGKSSYVSETVVAYELGYRAAVQRRLSGSFSLFYNDYDHVRSLSFTPNTILPLFFANNLEGHTYGAELASDFQAMPSWRIHAGYDFLKEHLFVKPGTSDLNDARNETADPEQQFSLRSSLDFPAATTFDARLRWVDTLHLNSGATVGTVPSYFELDVRLAWRPADGLEVSIVGQNLLHNHHPEYGFPGPDRVEISRNVFGKATWHF